VEEEQEDLGGEGEGGFIVKRIFFQQAIWRFFFEEAGR
jgi:hypothetical protein